MVKSIHGDNVPERLPRMNCGGIPFFDVESGFSYRCNTCFAVIGSFSQPQHCQELNSKASIVAGDSEGITL